MSPFSKHNTGSIACVVDTETTFIAKNPRLVFHFGAVMGDLEQENQFKPYTMDYYVKEVMKMLKTCYIEITRAKHTAITRHWQRLNLTW